MLVPWNLLIVEDDPDICETLDEVFESRGFHVLTASNGRDAIDAVNKHDFRPDAIVLDLMMPIMDGLEFLATRGDEARLAAAQVIVMSARVELLGGFRKDVYAALSKPPDLRRLVDAVEHACQGAPAG